MIFEKMNVKILGVVENMAYLQMPDGSKNRLFGESSAKECADKLSTELLCEIPIDPTLQSEHPSESASTIFDDLAREILKRLS